MNMLPAGYLFKKIEPRITWIKSENVVDICSVSQCISRPFADYINFWKHNGYWFFDHPDIVIGLAQEHHIDLTETQLFFYEFYEHQFLYDIKTWGSFYPEKSFDTDIRLPSHKTLLGYDVVCYGAQTNPECSPLSCNALANELPVNSHCLLETLEMAKELISSGRFENSEPGPYRIVAVYSVPFPLSKERVFPIGNDQEIK